MTLNSPVTELVGVGEVLGKKFTVLGINTVADFIDYYPRRYEDYSVITPIKRLRPGPVTIEAVVKQARGRSVRRGMHVTEAVVSEDSDSTRLVWFNQPYRAAALKSGQRYFISGQYELSRGRFAIMNPSIERASDFPVNTARILPVYRETKGLTSRQIRQAIQQALPLIRSLPETLPAWLVKQQKLLSRAEALAAIHFPSDSSQLEAARRRLGFEEVFYLGLASLLNKRENQAEHALKIPFDEQLAVRFAASLPFKLTDAQRLNVMRVYKDLEKGRPMNRLIEGDVGSGKTVVAVMAAVMALAQNWQVAFMAPTELLARQHHETIRRLLEPLGYEKTASLLVGSLSLAEKDEVRSAIKKGQTRFIIGTHALIQEQVDMHKLALIIIDEQQRFGVEQRKTLIAKAGHMPHVLSLTATPIPRSLALTVYGELDISVLKEKPAGRQPVATELVSPNSRKQLYAKIDKFFDQGRQMFVVCPLISPQDASELENGASLRSVEQVHAELSQGHFKHRRIGLLHGKLKSAERQQVMQKFIDRQLDILVSTTVIEVGVDVPNATIMLIENPERFGLAQLHQLRGRVGRSEHQAQCYLLLNDSRPPGRRLRALVSSQDGFRLAELDLELRGPGAIYGTMQHGQIDLRVAKLSDTSLISDARSAAEHFLEDGSDLLQYKQLMARVTNLRAITNLN